MATNKQEIMKTIHEIKSGNYTILAPNEKDHIIFTNLRQAIESVGENFKFIAYERV